MLSNKVHIGLAVSLLFAYISLLAGPNLIFSESMSSAIRLNLEYQISLNRESSNLDFEFPVKYSYVFKIERQANDFWSNKICQNAWER